MKFLPSRIPWLNSWQAVTLMESAHDPTERQLVQRVTAEDTPSVAPAASARAPLGVAGGRGGEHDPAGGIEAARGDGRPARSSVVRTPCARRRPDVVRPGADPARALGALRDRPRLR